MIKNLIQALFGFLSQLLPKRVSEVDRAITLLQAVRDGGTFDLRDVNRARTVLSTWFIDQCSVLPANLTPQQAADTQRARALDVLNQKGLTTESYQFLLTGRKPGAKLIPVQPVAASTYVESKRNGPYNPFAS